MARIKLTPKQREMLLALPLKEKDKLLLRLVAKEPMLLEQLSFEHLEKGRTADERANELRTMMREQIPSYAGHLTPGEVMMGLRSLSGDISRYKRVTKDKFGELDLMLEGLSLALGVHVRPMRKRYPQQARWDKLAMYVAKRLKTTIDQASKLHPDLWLELEPRVNKVLDILHDTPELRGAAERVGLERRWDLG